MTQNPENYPSSDQPRYGERLPQYGEVSGQYQAPPPPQVNPDGAVEIPRKVMNSFRLFLAAGVVYVLTQAWYLFQISSGAIDDELTALLDSMEEIMGSSVIDRGDILPLMTTSSIIGAVIGLGLFLLVGFLVKRGFAAGRILGIIFAVLTIFSLFAFPDFISWVLGLVAVIFAWSKDASAYNKSASYARMNAKFRQ